MKMPTPLLLTFLDAVERLVLSRPVWERHDLTRAAWWIVGEFYGRAGGQVWEPEPFDGLACLVCPPCYPGLAPNAEVI